MRVLMYLLIVVSCLGAKTYATQYESLDTIRSNAKDFLENQFAGQISGRLEIIIGNIDSRLKLAKCDQELGTFFPPGAKAINTSTVGVRCEGSHPWSIYIPVKVKMFSQVLVAAQPISRGAIISNGLFIQAEREMNALRLGYFQKPTDILGKQTKRQINVGQVINPRDLMEPLVMNRGRPVTISAKSGNLTVSTKGIALQNGRKDDVIQVQNSQSGKIVHGIVRGPNEVEVPLK